MALGSVRRGGGVVGLRLLLGLWAGLVGACGFHRGFRLRLKTPKKTLNQVEAAQLLQEPRKEDVASPRPVLGL